MSYTVNWITKIISVPTADLTLVSGTRYSLDMSDFLAEIRRLEWEFSGGLWAPPILIHDNTKVDFAGVDYAPFDDMLNGYTVEFLGAATRVDLLGSNNNIVDVLVDNGVSVVPSNSAGLQIVSVGSGLSVDQNQLLEDTAYHKKEIYINTELGVNGVGTESSPFNNVSDAVDFAELKGWKRLILLSDSTIERTLKNFTIEGIGLPTIDFNGQDVDKSEFIKVKLTGQQVGSITAREVILLPGLTGVNGVYKESGIAGDIVMANNSVSTFASISILFLGTPSPYCIDLGVGNTNVILNVRKISGAIEVKNCDAPAKFATFEFSGGKFIAGATNSNGIVGVAGLPESAVDVANATCGLILDGIFKTLTTQENIDLTLIKDVLEGDMMPTAAKWQILHKLTKAVLVDKDANVNIDGLTELTEP